jgi:hypothetical protein
MIAVLGAVPFWILGALIWPYATGFGDVVIFAGGYLLGIPATRWMLRERRRR